MIEWFTPNLIILIFWGRRITILLKTLFILQKIEKALQNAGASMEHVVRTRMFVIDISRFESYARAHGEVFKNIRPCTSMYEIKALVAPEYLIEIEATAIII